MPQGRPPTRVEPASSISRSFECLVSLALSGFGGDPKLLTLGNPAEPPAPFLTREGQQGVATVRARLGKVVQTPSRLGRARAKKHDCLVLRIRDNFLAEVEFLSVWGTIGLNTSRLYLR